MARPGHISDDIHEQVKVYSIKNSLDVPEAYENLLTAGMSSEGELDTKTIDKLDKFAEDQQLSRVEAIDVIIDSIIESDGSLKQGTIIKNFAIESTGK